MRARLGHMISPLCEKTRSTEADVAGEPNNRLNSSFSLTCDLPKYACHYMIINCIFLTKSAEQVYSVPWPGRTQSSAFSCPSCWRAAQVFFYRCQHARYIILAAYLSADTISYYCNGLPVWPLRPLLPLWPLLPSVGCGLLAAHRVLRSAVRGELLVPCAHWVTVQRRAFSVVGPSAWNDLAVELRSLQMHGPPFQILHLPEVLLLWPWLGCERLWVGLW